MADLSYSTTPTAGTTNNASDVVTPLNEIKTYVNGSGWVDTGRLKDANVTDTKLTSPNNSVYKTIYTNSVGLNGGTNGTYWMMPGYAYATGLATSTGYPTILRYASGDYSVAGLTTKFRIKMNVWCGSNSPSTTVVTAGLYPISISSGNWTLGTVVTGSTAASSGLATNTISAFNSGDFSASALLTDPGNYVVGFTLGSVSPSVANGIGASFELQYRHV